MTFLRRFEGKAARTLPPSDAARDFAEKRAQIEVVFATKGRPDLVDGMVARMEEQTLKPHRVIVSCASPEDIAGAQFGANVEIIIGAPGLARQRNAALRNLDPITDVVVFFDDDFVAHPEWLARVEQAFQSDVEVVAVTGNVLLDGIKGSGVHLNEALATLRDADCASMSWVRDGYSPYGCNMAFRRSALTGLEFDERLVLYGWLEDRDFGGALRNRGGRLIQLGSACGVHLAVKSGRLPGVRLGYSQVVNPVYLHGKGTMSSLRVIDHVLSNMASNAAKAARPEAYVDRAGRLWGNLIGLRDLIFGVVAPERASQL